MRVDPESLRQAFPGIKTRVTFEPHALQLQVKAGNATGITGSFELQPNTFVTHPCIPRQDPQLRLTPRLLFRTYQAQFASALFKCPVRNPNLFCQLPNTRSRSCVRMAEVNFSDTLVDLCGEYVFSSLPHSFPAASLSSIAGRETEGSAA